jgi:hypothetical protein
MLDHSSLTQFLGDVVTETNHYRCDWFIFLESVIARLHDGDDTHDKELDCIVASRDCCAEWIYPEQCDGESYNWHSILNHEKLYHIYKCKIYWEHSPFGWERQIKFKEINHDEMVEWMEYQKAVNDNVKEIKELIEIGD